ncbi:SDR family NAD(P)-dependent oxidoreductase [Streptomyces sp. TRM43335]|uniref:SDR family NAD(P)-dependent oxidoreductase n=1 Tax=Streptomyces taklimakanensis TaxID=2569853 RepID=A0A6G2BAQ3_9ACTN|nr:SDR family oxidoreductase [Streptomyces taklimakanensis]MTE19347.1 SDR family NAD(P)-dependent oxidoreductase [Streptomyces taklimakanensis]
MPLALVTGPTAGIGRAFADRLARDGYDLVLVSRSATDLGSVAAELRAAHGVRVETLPGDLSTVSGCRLVEERVASGPPVDLLVNNAGTALHKPFLHNGVEAEEALLDLNVRAVLRLTHAVLPGMLERGSGRVVNVASFTALGPAGLSSTYPASKAWVLSFSEALARSAQLRGRGVRMMALLPGFTRTELFDRSGFETAHLPRWVWLNSERVVDVALRDLERGRVVSIPGLRYKAASWALRHLPRPLLRSTSWDLWAPNGFWGPRPPAGAGPSGTAEPDG